MPRCCPLDTGVTLYVWDPQVASYTSNPSSNGTKKQNNSEQERSKSAVPYSICDRVSAPTVSRPTDVAFGDVDALEEEYFTGQEGVDFLGYAVPFFLSTCERASLAHLDRQLLNNLD